jgi:hypothetical protein
MLERLVGWILTGDLRVVRFLETHGARRFD